jgi:subtilisin family serine protease
LSPGHYSFITIRRMTGVLIVLVLFIQVGFSATIAIIDTGFDLDHDYLRQRIVRSDAVEDRIDFHGWDFFDNSHLKRPVIEDKDALQEVLKFRHLRAKGHRQGLTVEEFEWLKKKSADRPFMEKVKLFKKHSHGTFVAGIALREGENINIYPIRGLNIPNSVVAVEDSSTEGVQLATGNNPEEKFFTEIKQSQERVAKKFSKICRFIAEKKIEIVNASYGITFKGIVTKFRERYKEMTGKDIEETKLKIIVDEYFKTILDRGEKAMLSHPTILFVFSAGNSALDNDNYHHYPSKIKVPNAITVAAMNGDYLATFSNYGEKTVDIGAPGVAIPSLLPKVYAQSGPELYSLSSGTSMAAPFVANLAAQIKNINPELTPPQIKRVILETGTPYSHLKNKLSSGAVVDNAKALRAALLSKDLPLDQAISLGISGLIPIEDKISIGLPPAVSPEEVQKKVLDSFPSIITPQEVDEDPSFGQTTRSESSSPMDQVKAPQDNSGQPLLAPQDGQEKSADPGPSNQSAEQSLRPSEERPASSFQPQSLPPEVQSLESGP